MSTIRLLDMERFSKSLKEVTSTDVYLSRGTFHPDGLFSEDIFGADGTPERKTTFSYITLNTHVIHPSLISIVKRMNRNLYAAVKREAHFIIDKEGFLVPEPDGEIFGLSSVLQNFAKIKFKGGTEKRDDLSEMLLHYKKQGKFFIDKIPVMPVFYRDIIVNSGGKSTIDPINDYYKTILTLTFQLKTITEGIVFDVLSSNMQEAVNELYEYITSKISKKEGLIRHDLLGKRIDFSARSVVVGAGSELKSDEIGISFKMCIKLFEPFVLYQLLNSKNIDKVKLAKLLYEYNKSELSVSTIRGLFSGINKGDKIPPELEDILKIAVNFALLGKVVIAKRDPVLHSEGTMAFRPVLNDQDVIQLNPLFCDGYNADFDGDQMALFVPLTKESIEEVKSKMMTTQSKRGMEKTSFGFSKDTIAGLYALTKTPLKIPTKFPPFRSESQLGEFDIYAGITYLGIKTTIGRVMFNRECLPPKYPFVNREIEKKLFFTIINDLFRRYPSDTYRHCCDAILKLGFKYYTLAPATFSIDDLEIPQSIYKLKEKLKGAAPEEAQKILSQMESELAIYIKKKDLGLSIVAGSGTAKGGYGQLRQVLAAKGLIADISGNILPPFTASYADGLTPQQFFDVSPGTRKGIVNRALNTATTGYLARQLIYALQDIEVDKRIHDCKTTRTLDIIAKPDIASRLVGRYIVSRNGGIRKFDPKTDTGKLIRLRSPIYCRTKSLCLKCYGDLAFRNVSPYVGMIAANIIGERGTQLIMRTFHTGGAVSIPKIEIMKDALENFDEGRSRLFENLFKQQGSTFVCNEDCTIIIKTSIFNIEDGKIEFQTGKINLPYGYFYIRQGDITFDISLEYATIINVFDKYQTEGEDIIIQFKKGETMFACDPSSADFSLIVNVVKRLLSGKKTWKSPENLLMKIFDIYSKADSDADFVHFEVLVSNLLRDAINPRIPARLNQAHYNPIMVNLKSIPGLCSWLLSLEFENFNASIENGLTYARPEKESVLEKLVTGNL